MMKFKAEWTDDCSGKKNYDGEILSINTRYWPRGGGYLVVDFVENNPGKSLKIEGDETRQEVKPSALCKLLIRHGEDDSYCLIEREFEGETFEEVKAKVEQFAEEQFQIAVKAIQDAFYVDPNGSPR